MDSSSARGNSPERWEKFLSHLDDRLQLGLLTYLRRISSYHFEGDVLYIAPGSVEDRDYLGKDLVFQQLELLAQDSVKVSGIKLNLPEGR